MLHEIFILILRYDQLWAAGFVKSNVRMLQFTLPFIYKDKFLLKLGAFCHSFELNLRYDQSETAGFVKIHT